MNHDRQFLADISYDSRSLFRDRVSKKVSNADWKSPTDDESRIAKMKDGRTHLAYKAEHTVDLESEFLLDTTVYHADASDTATLNKSLDRAQANLEAVSIYRDIEKVAADKGYYANQTIVLCHRLDVVTRRCVLGVVKTYIPEPNSVYERRWTDKPPELESAYRNNRRRMSRAYGKALQRKRSELAERSFAHVCETGGARRTWLRGLEKVNKRYKIVAAARNLGLLMRKLFGVGKPRCLQGGFGVVLLIQLIACRLDALLNRPCRPTIRPTKIPARSKPLPLAI